MDTIFLHGLQADCIVGVWEWEKQITQKVIIDLDLGFDLKKAASTDQLENTLNYKEVAERVIDMLEKSRFELIERMADEIATFIMNEFSIAWVRVRLNKGSVVKNVHNVGILIERGEKLPA